MTTWTWKYDGHSTVVLDYDGFLITDNSVARLDCSDDFSNTPQHVDLVHNGQVVGQNASGTLAIVRIAFKPGNGPVFNCSLSDPTSGTILTTQEFRQGTAFGSPITEVPYGLELGDRNDLTADSYQDPNTVVRWNNVGLYDAIYGRPRQTGLGTNQVWYDTGYSTGKQQFFYLNPFHDSM